MVIKGFHLKTVSEVLTDAVDKNSYNRTGSSTGASSSSNFYNVQSVLMSETEVYGSTAWSSSGYETGTGTEQLPIFVYGKNRVNIAVRWSLRTVAKNDSFCIVGAGGSASYYAAQNRTAVRPRFVIA